MNSITMRGSAWRRTLAALVMALLFAWQAAPAAAQCDDPNFRLGPLSSPATTVPDTGPIELRADKNGEVTVVSDNSPGTFSTFVERFTSRVATAVPFRFAKKTKARIRFTTTSAGERVLRSFSIETATTSCALIDTFGAEAGRTSVVKADKIDQFIPLVQIPLDAGEYTVEFVATFKAGVTYRLIQYCIGERGLDGATLEFDAFEPPEPIVANSELKLLPIGADPTTGCPGTDLSNITSAYRNEAIAVRLFDSLNAIYLEATENGVDVAKLRKIRVAETDVEQFRELVNLSIQHLECAKELVEARTDLDEGTKANAIAELDRAIGRDDLALTSLDTQVLNDGSSPDAERLARLSQAAIALNSGLGIKQDAARIIDGAWQPPELGEGLSLDATLADAAALALDAEGQIEAALNDHRDKLGRIIDEVQMNGPDGLERVLLSNEERRCREFLRLTILGELNRMAAAVQQQRRKLELQKRTAATKAERPDKKTTKGVATIEKSVNRSRTAVNRRDVKTEREITRAQGNRPNASGAEARRFDRQLRKINREISGQRGIGAIILRRKQWDRLQGR